MSPDDLFVPQFLGKLLCSNSFTILLAISNVNDHEIILKGQRKIACDVLALDLTTASSSAGEIIIIFFLLY